MRRTLADYGGTMTFRRSPIALLCALVAVLALPAAASAFPSTQQLFGGNVFALAATDCVDPDGPPAGGPDVTPPVNTTALPPAGWVTSDYVVPLTGTDDTGVDHMQWCIDGGTAANAVPGTPVTINTSGVYTLITRAVDAAGNASPWRADTVSIDLSAPSDVTDSGTVNWTPTTRQVTVSAVDPVSGVDYIEWQLDGGTIHGDVNDTVVDILGDGSHILRTRAYDVAGNVSVWQDHTVKVDTVDPTDETAAPAGWQRAGLGITVAGNDAHSGIASVTYDLDGTGQTVPATSTTVTVNGDGDHTLTTYVTDVAGNTSTPQTFTIKIDGTAPNNTTPSADPNWRGSDYAVVLSGTDSGSGLRWMEWRVDGGAVTRVAPGATATVSGNGTHIFETRAIDVAGNASGWRSENVKIDKTAPINTTPTPPATVPVNYSVTVTGTDVGSDIEHVEWLIDGETEPNQHTGPDRTDVAFSTAGPHTLKTRVVDEAGNKSGWRTDTFTVDASLNNDATPPTDTSTTAPAGWLNHGFTFTVKATDAVGVDFVQIARDGLPVETFDGDSHDITFDTEGVHDIETSATDVAGNESPRRAQVVKIDLTVPTDTTDIPTGWTNSLSFTLSGTDALSGIASIEYRINGGSIQTGADGDTVTVGGDGVYTIQTRARDRAGQLSGWTTRTLKVDRVLPVNTTSAPGTGWLADPLSLDLTGTDVSGSGIDKMQWRLDGGAVTDGGPAVVDTDGTHTLETRAVDQAGNQSVWRTDTVKLDLTAPEITTPEAPAGWINTPYDVTVAGDDGAGSGIATTDVLVDGVAATTSVSITDDGEHTIETTITDNVGHESTRTDTVKIDTAIPTASLSCTTVWTTSASCTPVANGGLSGLGALTLATDSGTPAPVTSGHPVSVTTNGVHTLTLKAVDGAGNEKTVTAQVKVDRTIPTVSLSCAAATTPTGYVCHASGADAASGLYQLAYSFNGGAWTTVPSGGTFNVAFGTVRVRALDVAGNQALTSTLTLVERKVPVKLRTATAPVYLAGKNNPDSMVGAIRAARSPSGTVSIDLRPLAVGSGKYQVQITLKSGKHTRTVKKTYTVGRDGTLRRMAASLAHATGKTTVTLTVRKQHGTSWRKHATARIVLPK
jgi:hypothetical protein